MDSENWATFLAKIQAEELYSMLSTEQIEKTGLTIDSIKMIEERRLLVQLYTKSFMGENELSGYIDNIMNCIYYLYHMPG